MLCDWYLNQRFGYYSFWFLWYLPIPQAMGFISVSWSLAHIVSSLSFTPSDIILNQYELQERFFHFDVTKSQGSTWIWIQYQSPFHMTDYFRWVSSFYHHSAPLIFINFLFSLSSKTMNYDDPHCDYSHVLNILYINCPTLCPTRHIMSYVCLIKYSFSLML